MCAGSCALRNLPPNPLVELAMVLLLGPKTEPPYPPALCSWGDEMLHQNLNRCVRTAALLRGNLGALYHLPELLSKNNAPSVILITDALSTSEGISCWRSKHIHPACGGFGDTRFTKCSAHFHLPLYNTPYIE